MHSFCLSKTLKMKSSPKPFLDIGTDNAVNHAIPDLVSYLQSTFLPQDFEKVKQILLAREEKIKKEMDSVEAKHGEMALSKLILEDEMKAGRRECEELREQVLRLTEDKRVASDREVRGEDRYRNLVEDVRNQEEADRARVVELQGRIMDLERGKRSAEALVELYKKRFEDLGSRVSRLEEDAKVLMSEPTVNSTTLVEEEIRAADGVMDDRNGDPKGPHSNQITRSIEAKKEIDLLNSEMKLGRDGTKKEGSEAVIPSNRMVSPMQTSGRHTCEGVVEIIDSDDEPMGDNSSASGLKRKRASPSGGSDDDGSVGYGSQSVRLNMKRPQELIRKKEDLHGDHCSMVPTSSSGKGVETSDIPSRQSSGILRSCGVKFRSEQKSPQYTSDIFLSQIDSCDIDDGSSDSSESEDDANADDWIFSKIESKRTTMWEIESDLVSSLEKDPTLCMTAVCALYREKFFEEKPIKGLELPSAQNIEKSDALRGTALAEFLIDGDPEGKLKKSILDLQKQVPRGLHDCKRLATQYSTKLFEIYRKWGDPHFDPIFSKLQ